MIYTTTNPIEKQKAKERFDKLINKNCTFELTEKKPNRTIKQNSYLHLILGWFSIELGYNISESKELFKRLNKDVFEYHKGKLKFFKSSANLDTSELTKCIDKFRTWSSLNAGVYLPGPDEKDFLNEIDKQIKNKREFL